MSVKQLFSAIMAERGRNIFPVPLYKAGKDCYNSLAKCTGGSMDRASDSGSEGWGFESLPVYQTNKRDTHLGIPLICFALRAGGTRRIKCNSPVDCCRRRLDGGEPLSAPYGSRCKRVLLRFPVCALPTAGLRCTQTAATRSGRCICPRQRSLRSPFRCTAKRSLAIDF